MHAGIRRHGHAQVVLAACRRVARRVTTRACSHGVVISGAISVGGAEASIDARRLILCAEGLWPDTHTATRWAGMRTMHIRISRGRNIEMVLTARLCIARCVPTCPCCQAIVFCGTIAKSGSKTSINTRGLIGVTK